MDILVWIVVLVIFALGFRLGWHFYRSRRAQPSVDRSALREQPSVDRSAVPEGPSAPERKRVDLRSDLPAGYELLIQGPGLDVVGESRYRPAIERAVGRRPEGHKTIVNAALVAEPDNRYDPNAIAIQISGQTVGYLAREDALRYRPVTDWYRTQGFVPRVRADVRGGWRQDDGSWADFGITLYVASPEKILDPRPSAS